MVVFLIVGIVALAVGVFLSVLKKPKVGRVLIVVAGVLVLLGSSIVIVPTGYTGVRTTFGQVSTSVVPNGFSLKIPFVQSVALVNNKQQDKLFSEKVWGESADKTPVYANAVVVTYQVDSAKSSWIYANVTGSDKGLVDQNVVSSAIKASMVSLAVEDVTNRAKIEPTVQEYLQSSLNEKYGENTVTIVKVVIKDMDFEESYNAAIAEKSIALQTQQKQQIENDTAVAKAEADKKVAITNAEAKAEAKRIEAEAEADANKKVADSLTNEILKSKFYEKWNGTLPNAMGSDTVITDISK